MNGAASFESECSEFVEIDPTGRYGRYDEVLGKGASKTVYRAFDEFQGIEVAWNQVKLYHFLQNPEDLERLYREIHLLKTLKHKNIMNFYTSWVDPTKRHINFVTEMFTSGTLRRYRLKHKKVSMRAVKHWCRQILEGLLYLHSHEPPVIHRDLKCDNIFINGNQGEVKIGDLGLAAVLRKSNDTRCVGTPEFMAPEVYNEDYNELVDIYSFGMCILEMVTLEYPYSECSNPAQIYKKVISGKKPEALYKVKDPEVRQFIKKCLVPVSLRLSAKELLKDPFLQIDYDCVSDLRPLQYDGDCCEVPPLIRQPLNGIRDNFSSLIREYTGYLGSYEPLSELDYHQVDFKVNEIDLFECKEVDELAKVDTTTVKVRRREDDSIFLRLRIADKEGRVRNIYFPFDIETDTAMSVANEMVAELDMIDEDVSKIADMIDNEIVNLVPQWTRGPRIEDSPEFTSAIFCLNCASLFDHVSANNKSARYVQFLQCSEDGCAAVHGRFEEITYQVEGSESCAAETTPAASRQPKGFHYTDIWAQRDEPEANPEVLNDIYCQKSHEKSSHSIIKEDKDDQSDANNSNLISGWPASDCALPDYENEIRQELRWLKAKYQMQLTELRDNQLEGEPKSTSIYPDTEDLELIKDNVFRGLLVTTHLNIQRENLLFGTPLASWRRFPVADEKKCCIMANIEMVQDFDAVKGGGSLEQMVTAKDFYKGAFLPHSLHKATSLPLDAVDF